MRNSRSQFFSLLCFLIATALLLSNGFTGRIFAQRKEADIWQQIRPMADVLDEILKNYVREPKVEEVTEGALTGMLGSLDEHSSFVPARVFKRLQEETEGSFCGIGVRIHLDEGKNIAVFHPIAGSPAAKAGLLGGDIIFKIDGERTKNMSLDEAADKIRGPRGSIVHLTIVRRYDSRQPEILEKDIKREEITLESVDEARVLKGGVGYVRVSDFKKTTADEMTKWLRKLQEQGMKSLILDLRWDPGGLLNASVDVCDLFLPKGTLVTFTKARDRRTGELVEQERYFTTKAPVLPENFPMVVLVNEQTASSSEIVTGALQFWRRAIVVGMKTYGKGSVQTITPLRRPEGSAVRLTTALYYTPAEITIDQAGIHPDVEVPFPKEQWLPLHQQMFKSYESDENKKNAQNHGAVTGNEVTADTVEDVQLARAVEILLEDPLFENLLAKYHRDPRETQVAATAEQAKKGRESDDDDLLLLAPSAPKQEAPPTEEPGSSSEEKPQEAPKPGTPVEINSTE